MLDGSGRLDMNREEAEQNKSYFYPYQGHGYTFTECDGICVTNGLVPLPLASDCQFHCADTSSGVFDIPLNDEDGKALGFLCLCKKLSMENGPLQTSAITDAQFSAYVAEVNAADIAIPFTFARDYIVLDVRRYTDYKSKYLASSPIWGGFYHYSSASPLPPPHTRQYELITAVPGISLPTKYHSDSAVRSTTEPYGFGRFLKLYHLFELIYDWYVVKRIQELTDDIPGINLLLSSFSNTEISRLQHIVSDLCDGIDNIALKLNTLNADVDHLDRAKIIFFKYGKQTGILSDEQIFAQFMKGGGFTLENVKKSDVKNVSRDQVGYQKLVVEMAARWVYRVRCSIAHSKIGEHIMSEADERFVVEFAEPLLRELLCQALSSGKL